MKNKKLKLYIKDRFCTGANAPLFTRFLYRCFQFIQRCFQSVKQILKTAPWHLQILIPRKKNVWIFGAWFGKKYSDNSKALFEYMLEHHPEYSCTWITKDEAIYKQLREENIPVAMADSKEGKHLCLTAKIAICTHDMGDFNHRYINGITQVWLWHGMPLKKICLDDEKNYLITDIFNPWSKRSPDYTVTSSKFFTPFLQSALGLSADCIFETGLPRCDYLFNEKTEGFMVKLKAEHSECKIIMYMPTFRAASYNGLVFDPFASFGFNKEIFHKALIENNYVFLYKPHFCDETQRNSLEMENFYIIGDNDYIDLYRFLKDVDILITDYSSVYFDFIAAKKPVILAPFDYENYIKESRAHYFDYFDNMEGIKAKNWAELLAILSDQTYYPVSPEAVEKYAAFNDGHSSEKTFRAIEAKLKKSKGAII